MKNLYKLIGIIALVAVIGFSFAACSDDDGSGGGGGGASTFTLTDIPAECNGMYASSLFSLTADMVNIWGGNDPSILGPGKGIRISNGRVSIPQWINGERYKGNDTITNNFLIYINSSETDAGPTSMISKSFKGFVSYKQVTFSNGSATKSWNDADTKNLK